MLVAFGSCVSYLRNFCDGPIPRPEESYRVCGGVCLCVTECDQVLQ
jgi:hypothetical protein